MAPERVLLLVATSSYRTDAFVEATRRLGATGVIGSDRCHVLDGIYRFPEDTLALDFRHPDDAVAQIVAAARARRFDAIVPTNDATAVLAARAGAALGLPHNPPDAAYTARNKARMREALARAGVPCPRWAVFSVDDSPARVAEEASRALGWPLVVKPLLLSGSRGVIRADDPASCARAFERLRAILTTPEQRDAATQDPAGGQILVEEFVPGVEVALESVVAHGRFHALALFDKPDPLDGPFFEETIYVTPSRLPPATQALVLETTRAAAAAMGLVEGPVHAELRVDVARGIARVIEVAARPIGGLCARTLRFSLGEGAAATEGAQTLEDLVVGLALGRWESPPARQPGAAGVMMLPIPRAGVLQSVDGEADARAVPGVVDLAITTRVGEKLVPLPEGSSYLGFLFARGETPAAVEEALRAAHAKLAFTIAPLL